ncbi:general transcription factor IIE subunit 1 [Rhineura floridana]|uniref:general transcription factor IIE subunit 1 n=1 Tax=Rhineura floridana TaxID=261503 RepID=UPI002AC84581|nr:general transcription factor IIE subunit 1 [Rhineura floridana]XP_061494429.1 general transcription factor IIE subunit 1 [Rhineura floridana]XP_061494437.1 general transcription factor IIE subunit 1 [Rhineura floridana]XP_061494448.1 general transcription factor IIE subunit 1 [Rhineura floridana]XP_061494456.1 general transcription factor IIE subunit 1 [Rhineura floridana]
MTDPDVLTEVPAALKRLAKYVVRGFYGTEHALALDILIRNPCVKEEDMLELLKFDRKQLRAVLNTLKGDKFIKCRMRVETASDGKMTRHNFYFINYRLLVNVVKYKLDHMRRRIETDERDSTNRASFRCPICFSTFTDLEANQLFDPMTGIFRCTFCETEVEEDESAMPKKDARTLVARFNEQIEPIYALLRETEDVNLAYELLEPEPMEILALKQSKERAVGALGNSSLLSGQHKEAWTTKGPSYEDLYTQNVIISMEDQEDLHQPANEGKPPRERPVWLRESTVQGAFDPDDVKEGGQDTNMLQEGEEGQAALDNNEEVMRALLIHEKKTPSASAAAMGGIAPLSSANASDSESETSESDEDSPPHVATAATTLYGLAEEDDDDEFEVVTEDPTVMVAGRPFSYSQVNQRPELVAQMTLEEKEQYIAMGQRMFEDMFD